jgi:hypothetical protein
LDEDLSFSLEEGKSTNGSLTSIRLDPQRPFPSLLVSKKRKRMGFQEGRRGAAMLNVLLTIVRKGRAKMKRIIPFFWCGSVPGTAIP